MSWVDLTFVEAVEADLRKDNSQGLDIAVATAVGNSAVVSKPHLMHVELPARNRCERLLAATAEDLISQMYSEIS